ncbi:helix-turn-helix domain-containing protein [Paenibacillus sp. MWE-103]|uniref:Helix-turn-helix domain-containing protein n=1 Tax=Paenibacillus artemisiicola TaxID=1172618 RepID=A0ABS3W3G6_9BACL|nr:AraC family transcriptional regulator [Paenibacillus artemisiicola]MBO7742845.1 helix-turn-helix domain-containing protein [Paenibacillus artemisiicola]
MIDYLCGASLGKARCEPGWAWSPGQPMPDYDVWYALEGKGRMTINGERFPIGKGSCFLLRPGDRVRATQDEDHRLTVIFVHFAIEGSPEPELPGRHVQFEDGSLVEPCLQRILDLRLRGEPRQDEEFGLLIRLVLLHMARREEAMREPLSAMHRQLVHKVIDELADRAGRAVSAGQLAAAVGVSPRHLSQLFKQHTGHSLKAYMTRFRLERARFLLSETSMNITEVAAALGYSDIYHFSKAFKQHYGAPPSRYRFKGRPAASHYGE